MSDDTRTYLVTGSMGCIGAWALTHLVRAGQKVISYDLSPSRHRLDQLLPTAEQDAITFVEGDITNFDQLRATLADHEVDRVLHLAALQVPFCRADPVLGAQVNVTGSINVMEAALNVGIGHIAYASSVAVYGSADDYPPGPLKVDAPRIPHTLYGGYKVANEDTARVYWQDHQLSSIGLRPHTVYGVGRDQGLTSDPTKAMLAAARQEPFEIGFSGPLQLHYASDVALQFIAAADHVDFGGSRAVSLGGPVITVEEIVAEILANRPEAEITISGGPLPFPAGFDETAVADVLPGFETTPIAAGIAETMAGDKPF